MLIKVQLLPQKKRIELINEVIFTAEVICSAENPVQTEWGIEPKGLSDCIAWPQFLSLTLVKKADVFTLKVKWEMDDICFGETFDVAFAEEVTNFPAIQRRYKR